MIFDIADVCYCNWTWLWKIASLFSCEVDNYVLLFHNDDHIIKYNNIANFSIQSRIV
jgi:hypothetical protein